MAQALRVYEGGRLSGEGQEKEDEWADLTCVAFIIQSNRYSHGQTADGRGGGGGGGGWVLVELQVFRPLYEAQFYH